MYHSAFKSIINWYVLNKRDLPWRNTTDPYKIWLSEVILQQTRVDQGLAYYYKFVELFPDIATLAFASEDSVMKAWQGLGYYSRARNLQFAANQIMKYYNGIFPNNYEEILKLKGIGAYTAAAIASFAFGEEKAVVDGNVYRLLSRFFGIETSIDISEGKKLFQKLVDELIDKNNPGLFNQAIMEFGAMVCKPSNPKCTECVLIQSCFAYKNKVVNFLPVKSKKTKALIRNIHYLILKDSFNNVLLQKRKNNDIWNGLYQFVLLSDDLLETNSLINIGSCIIVKEFKPVKHILTHQHVFAKFTLAQTDFFSKELKEEYEQYQVLNLHKIAFPRLISRFIEKQEVQKFLF
jgi:A/G-specific adenine glycosylase